ncbi:Uncharacterized protein SCF082_LOCUS35550 [Durusdinium trenchii]|uniref:PAN domain protein n=1 Tax=Durusdinium trenchii TaxID=1381693 RepID=A0ABP0P8T7_9DINO
MGPLLKILEVLGKDASVGENLGVSAVGVAGIVVIGFGVGIERPSMRLSGFGACAGGNMDALGAWGVGGIWGGAGGRGIRMLRVGGESNVGAVRGARSSPAVVNWSKAVEPKRRVWAVDPRDAESSKAPEFFGDPVACIEPDVVGKAFKNGQEIIELQLLPAELDTPADAVQNGSLSLAMPSCSKPTEDLLFGTVSVPDYYSLHPCECFGETHAHVEPVDAESNAAVPRKADGKFNVGLVPDQRLFSGPYTCEESASLGDLFHIDLERCQRACASKAQCGFYLFGKASERCTLFQRCNYIQDVGLQIENELYGMAPSGNSTYCHIANPERCWEEIKRRSMLSVEPSEIPPCLFHHQADACDALQLLLGKQDGSCTRCRYMEASTSFAESGLRKVPLPESFSPASQISASCNDTSRLFAKIRGGVQWEGPRQNATFTCVSGKWIGELGSWQYMSNFTCQRCVQIGDASLQRLSLVSMPEVYFLQKRCLFRTFVH